MQVAEYKNVLFTLWQKFCTATAETLVDYEGIQREGKNQQTD